METDVRRGKLIVFEGIDGSGKTTQLKAVEDWLWQCGVLQEGCEVRVTHEPGYLPEIRSILKDPLSKITPKTELLLLMADRAQHVEKFIKPQLKKGNWVLCDRFYASTVAYQGWGRGLGWQAVRQAHELACGPLYPDLEIFLDIPPDESAFRIKKRGQNLKRAHGKNYQVEDRFELQGREFMSRVVEGYSMANRLPFLKEYPHVTVDACCKPGEVTEACIGYLRDFVRDCMSVNR